MDLQNAGQETVTTVTTTETVVRAAPIRVQVVRDEPVPMKNVLTGTIAAAAGIIAVAVVGIAFAGVASSGSSAKAPIVTQPASPVVVPTSPAAKPPITNYNTYNTCRAGAVCTFR